MADRAAVRRLGVLRRHAGSAAPPAEAGGSAAHGGHTVLVANRGEVASRVCRAAAALGMKSVAVWASDDRDAVHVNAADRSFALPGAGPAAYLDVRSLVGAATATGATILHPGYGFCSENPELAEACQRAGVAFAGPVGGTLRLCGDKRAAKAHAGSCGVPILPSSVTVDGDDAGAARIREFFEAHGARELLVKAVAGGGGRGMRRVTDSSAVAAAVYTASREAAAAFGDGRVFAELYVRRAYHIEIQLLGNGEDVVALGERDCSIQLRHQKRIEVAPCSFLHPRMRLRLMQAALVIGKKAELRSLATVEFLVAAPNSGDGEFWFLEINPRLQVEAGVTETVTGVDLVQAQLLLAASPQGRTASLRELGVTREALEASASLAAAAGVPSAMVAPRGTAIEARVYAEQVTPDGEVKPSRGSKVTNWRPPGGPGIRVDSAVAPGTSFSFAYDPLLCKLVGSSGRGVDSSVAVLCSALRELDFGGGIETNAAVLVAVLSHPDFSAGRCDTQWMERNAAAVAGPVSGPPKSRYDGVGDTFGVADKTTAVLPGQIVAHTDGDVVEVCVAAGDTVEEGQQLVVLRAMKMEHAVNSPYKGVVQTLTIAPGARVRQGDPLLVVSATEADAVSSGASTSASSAEAVVERLQRLLDEAGGKLRPELAEVRAAKRALLDSERMGAGDTKFARRVRKRHAKGQLSARESIAAFLDDDAAFDEIGGTVVAAQRGRHDEEWLVKNTPADGVICGTGTACGVSCAVLAYDATVLAGTQGGFGHLKSDRLLDITAARHLPLVLFAEGGGGRPGDVDFMSTQCSTLSVHTFAAMARLSGLVPVVGIVTGYCFAGNAALLGCCDVIIAVAGCSLGMAGPAMIEGGGLGEIAADAIGPVAVHQRNGVADIVVQTDAAAVEVARQYLAYFVHPRAPPEGGDVESFDQALLRVVVPAERSRAYDPRDAIVVLADAKSWLELRRGFGNAMITGMMRIDGRAVGVLANDPQHLSGAVDGDAALKASRFMELCDAHGIPLLFLCDTPGFMVGAASEREAAVRKVCRMFVVAASLSVPHVTVVLRRAFGLGAMAMAAGAHMGSTTRTLTWPTGVFGGMGIEGAVKLGFKAQVAAAAPGRERAELIESLVAEMARHGRALNNARFFEVDDVIDPADTRAVVSRTLYPAASSAGTGGGAPHNAGKRRPCVSTW